MKTHYMGGIRGEKSFLIDQSQSEKTKEKKGRKVAKIAVSRNQTKMYSLDGKGEVFVW